MTATTVPAPAIERIHVPVVAWLATVVALSLLFVVLQENGALLSNAWETLHEFFHDGRHFFGVPCH
jgi:hypothetical protein